MGKQKKHESRDDTLNQTKELTLDLLGIKAMLRVPSDMEGLFLQKSSRFLPIDSKMKPASGADDHPIRVSVKRGSPFLYISGKKAELVSNADEDSIVADSLILVSRLLEKELNKQDIFSMNASSISFGNSAVLLIGPYGAGKTTTAVYACLKDKSIGYVTGNMVFIKGRSKEILYGMDSISLRIGSILNEFEPSEDLPKRLALDTTNVAPGMMVQSYRISMASSQLGITRAAFPLKIKEIFIVRKMDSDFVEFEQHKKGNKTEIMLVHSALCEYSEKGYVMLGPRLHLPDIVTNGLKARRLNLAESIATEVPIKYAEGRMKDILTNTIRGCK